MEQITKSKPIIEAGENGRARFSFKELFLQLGAFGCAGVLAQIQAFGPVTPFALAFCAAVPQPYAILSVAGACMGYTAALDDPIYILRYLITVLGVMLTKRICLRLLPIKRKELFSSLLAAVFAFATGFTIMLSQGIRSEGVLQFGSDAVLAGGMTWFWFRAFRTLQKGKEIFWAGRRELVGLGLCCCNVLIALGEFQIWNVAPANALGAFLVLSMAFVLAESGGAIFGICVGAALFLAQGNASILVVFGLGGLLCGLFAPAGQLAVAAVFSVMAAFAAVLDGSAQAVSLLFEVAAASVIFVAMPKRIFLSVRRQIQGVKGGQEAQGTAAEAAVRLSDTSQAIRAVSTCVENVAKRLETVDLSNAELTVSLLRQQVCANCSRQDICWQENVVDTQRGMEAILLRLRGYGHVMPEDFPQEFRVACGKTAQLAVAGNRLYLEQAAQRGTQMHIRQMRDVVTEQFRSMSDVLSDMAQEMQQEHTQLPEAAKRAQKVLEQQGIPCHGVSLVRNALGHVTLGAELSYEPEMPERETLLRALHFATGVHFGAPQINQIEQGYQLTCKQRISYRIHVGMAQRAREGARMCGDYAESFQDHFGRKVTVLSDGMGTGSHAAVDSAMAAELFSKLCEAGLHMESALKIVNAALLVKSSDESMATLDVVIADLYSGKVQFCKAGAAASFVRQKHKVMTVEFSSLPAGILREIQFAGGSTFLGHQDIVLLVSDGALPQTESNQVILQTLRNWEGWDVQALAERIIALAMEQSQGRRADDISAVALMLEKI